MKRLIFLVIGILVLAALAVPLGILLVTPVKSSGSPTQMIVDYVPLAPTAAPTNVPARPQPVNAVPTQTPSIPQTGSSPATATALPNWSGVVNADPLNLRLGPGKSYPIARTLSTGQEVRIDGRSNNGQWLVVTLPDGTTGWVMASYIDTSVSISSLPDKEASGGPVGSGVKPTQATAVKKYNIYVTISENIATVSLSRFPANSDVVLSLGLPGKGADLKLATAHTDANGSGSISFEMPAEWSDGSSISETNLSMIAATADGKFSRTASIQYYQ